VLAHIVGDGEHTIGELIEAFSGLGRQQARAVILRAKPGARVWSAGHDINELPQPGRDPLHYLDPLEQLIRAIRSFPGAVIALIEGSVWGGACELALCCDLIVATPSSTFALTPARLGVPYNSSGVLRVMNAVGMMLAKEMFFTAAPVPAERVWRAGVISQLVEPAEIEEQTRALARRISENSPLAIAVLKETLRLLGNAAPLHPETFERIQGLRRAVYDSADYREGVEAFQQKRKPSFTGE
jgi:methylmalonyl-CoA decarboxylase